MFSEIDDLFPTWELVIEVFLIYNSYNERQNYTEG